MTHLRISESVEIRVCVLNDGTPFGPLTIDCEDDDEAQRKFKSWRDDPELGVAVGAEVWIERRVIGPWVRETDR